MGVFWFCISLECQDRLRQYQLRAYGRDLVEPRINHDGTLWEPHYPDTDEVARDMVRPDDIEPRRAHI